MRNSLSVLSCSNLRCYVTLHCATNKLPGTVQGSSLQQAAPMDALCAPAQSVVHSTATPRSTHLLAGWSVRSARLSM